MVKIIKPLKRIKWGVAGCGRYSEMTFIPNARLARRNTINAVFSNNTARAKAVAEKYGISSYFSNYDDFLASDINAVYVGSANAHHYKEVIKAAEAGKHILCDKPMAVTSQQAKDMIDACEKNGVQLAVNYVYRFHPLIIKAKELIESQMLGKLVSITLSFNIDFPPGSNFRFKKELSGGGALRDLGTHTIDMLRFFGGEFDILEGVVDNIIYKSEVDDFASGLIKYHNSGYGYFDVSFNSKKAFNGIEIICHKGAINIQNIFGVRPHVPSKFTILIEGEAKKTFRKRSNMALQLLRSVQKSFLGNETPAVTGYDGLINLKLMEELEEKCRKREN